MKRFRINKTDKLNVNVFCKNEQIINSINPVSGFENIEQVKKWIINLLSWEYRGLGRRIEIEIFNRTKNQIKYINTFS
jgi:hypothetical protein